MSRSGRTASYALDRADRRGCSPSNPWRPTSSVRSNLNFGSDTQIAKGQHDFSRDRGVKTLMNASDECISKNRAQENKRGIRGPFDEHHEAQAVIRAPKCNSKAAGCMPHC